MKTWPSLSAKRARYSARRGIVGVVQQRGRRARRLEHVVVHDVAHQADEHQVDRVAQRFAHRQDLAVVLVLEVAEVVQAAAGEERLRRDWPNSVRSSAASSIVAQALVRRRARSSRPPSASARPAVDFQRVHCAVVQCRLARCAAGR